MGGKGGGRCGVGGMVNHVGSGRLSSSMGGFSSSTVTIWVVPANGGKGADADMSSRGGWLVSEEDVNGESEKDRKENGEENQHWCGGV